MERAQHALDQAPIGVGHLDHRRAEPASASASGWAPTGIRTRTIGYRLLEPPGGLPCDVAHRGDHPVPLDNAEALVIVMASGHSCDMRDQSRQLQRTRTAILEAAAQLLLERGNGGFSVQTVADRAGLTHRTVYRYFPTRQDLMAATARSLAPELEEDAFAGVATVEEWIDAVGPRLARTEANLEIVRSLLVAILASGDPLPFGQQVTDRDSHRWHVFTRQFPHLADDDARRTFAILRHQTSSTCYLLFRLRFAMSPAEAIAAIQDGATQVVAQAALRDRARAQEETR